MDRDEVSFLNYSSWRVEGGVYVNEGGAFASKPTKEEDFTNIPTTIGGGKKSMKRERGGELYSNVLFKIEGDTRWLFIFLREETF